MFDEIFLTQYVGGIGPAAPFTSPRDLSSVEQRWFVGSHGNVGGGSEDDLLAQLPLNWLIGKAEQHGILLRQALDVDEDAAGEIDDSFKAFLKGAYALRHAEQRHWRPIGRPPEPWTHMVMHTINEIIDASVRMLAHGRQIPAIEPGGIGSPIWRQDRGLESVLPGSRPHKRRHRLRPGSLMRFDRYTLA